MWNPDYAMVRGHLYRPKRRKDQGVQAPAAGQSQGREQMNIMIVIGIILGCGTIIVDRYFLKLPNWLAILLFAVAIVLIIAGMIITRKSAG